ncbi:MAG: hypothetical protein IJA91_01800 [Clostridia bacterium]|nr:hypothetical protein [Clostridia bacterium]
MKKSYTWACFVLGCICLVLLLTSCSAGNSRTLGEYLSPYEAQAVEFLLADKGFVAVYGGDCVLDATGFSYTYTDPGKFTAISLSPKIPATAAEFAREVKEIQVNFNLPDDRACSVLFQKTPEGGLEITGWAYTDETE